MLKIEPDANVKIVDRTRESKYSFHVVIPGFIVKRVQLKAYIAQTFQKLIKEKKDETTLFEFIDTMIYREKGSLRISTNEIIYNYQNL